MKSFKELGLSSDLLKVLEEINFSLPSEIQEKVIPLALAGKDVIGGSATGSGKTLAFSASIIEKIEPGKGIQTLILTPTRELTEQVSRAFRGFSKFKPLRVVSIYGGVAILPQIEALEKADVVVGTPGRLLDHLSRKTINLSKVKYLVLDEADRMLDMGFIEDVSDIINECPKDRQSFLFSATISPDITHIAKKYMNKPVEVSVESYVDATKLENVFYDVFPNEKFSLLVHLLTKEKSKLVMVFCNTKRNVDFIAKNLKIKGFDALALHGDLSQRKRNQILEHFHKSEKFILVCTDVAARGLDIKQVSHVYNYDCPKTSKEYIHRVGRTARAGKKGKAITILANRDYDNFRRVEEDESLDIKREELPKFEKVFIKMSGPRRDFGGRGRSDGRGRSNFRRNDRRDSRGRGRSDSRGRSDGRNRDSRGRSNFRRNDRRDSRGRSDGRSRSDGRRDSRGRSDGRSRSSRDRGRRSSRRNDKRRR